MLEPAILFFEGCRLIADSNDVVRQQAGSTISISGGTVVKNGRRAR